MAHVFHLTLFAAGLSLFSLAAHGSSDCRIVFDAGSSGTRLYVFEKQGTDWVEHEGPKVSALADPVRQIRGKTWDDADALVTEVVGTLDSIKLNGPTETARNKWKPFDWSAGCATLSAGVYATAGMRIAERDDAKRAALLWGKLKSALESRLGPSVAVTTKTLTGFEEGLFAWMSLQQRGKGTDFGLVEMGGASAQVTFPCASCADTKQVVVSGKRIAIYGHSFLGMGSDEAARTLGASSVGSACALDSSRTGTEKARRCGEAFKLTGNLGMFAIPGTARNAEKAIAEAVARIPTWYAAGAFAYFKPSDVDACCTYGNTCYQPAKACFRSVYFRKFLDTLGMKHAVPSDSNWALGAVTCEETRCLEEPPPD